jgi:chromosome segregation ATPase
MDAQVERAVARLPDVMDKILGELRASREERAAFRVELHEARAERAEFRKEREDSREFMRQLTLRHERAMGAIDRNMRAVERRTQGAERGMQGVERGMQALVERLEDMGDQIRANTAAVLKALDRLDHGGAAA